MSLQKAVEQLKPQFRGQLLMPSDEGYEVARKVYNGMIDKRPGAIARCVNVADVMAAVRAAREQDVLAAIRGGGHNGGGLGICDDGLVIDLSLMRGVRVDPAARTVRAEGGCTGADVDHATHAFGMATPTGTISTTGIAGLTLGGGIGHLSRPYGLTIDNLLAVDVVLADGSFVTADAEKHTDLYWAVRGGGGNFGVVTSFLFRLHPVKMVSAGPTFWPLDQTPQVMKAYREFITQAPEDVSGFFAFLTVPPVPLFPANLHNQKMCGIIWCSTAAPEKADQATKAMRSVGKPALDHVGRCRSPQSKACSMASTRRACSGTGGPTSSKRSATRPSRRISSTLSSFPPDIPRCTCIPSTAPLNAWAIPTPRSAIATLFLRGSSWASIPTPRTRKRSPAGPRSTSTRCTRIRREGPTSTS